MKPVNKNINYTVTHAGVTFTTWICRCGSGNREHNKKCTQCKAVRKD